MTRFVSKLWNADGGEGGGGKETPDKEAEKQPEAKSDEPDPYAGLSEEERQFVQRVDDDWKRATPAERARFARLANKGLAAIQAEEAAGKKKPEADKAVAETDDPDKLTLKELRAEVDALKADRKAEADTKAARERTEKFFGLVDEELGKIEELQGQKKTLNLIKLAATGQTVLTNRSDVRDLVRELAKDFLEEDKPKREAWAREKAKTRDETGEGRGGRAAMGDRPVIKAGDNKSGRTGQLVRAAYGVK